MALTNKEIYDLEIVARGKLESLERNLFVIAGAGAGKSTSLVSRIVGFLEQGESTSNFVAISFTNKASEELRTKIITELSDRISNEKHAANHENLVKALNSIDQMHISTIHKFCGDILRENSIYAALNPSFRLLSPDEDLNRKKQIFNEYFKTLSKKDFELFDCKGKSYSTVKKEIETIYNKFCCYIDKIEKEQIYNYNCVNEIDIVDDVKDFVDLVQSKMGDMLDLANTGRKKAYSAMEILRSKWYEKIYIDERKIDFKYAITYNYDFPFHGGKFQGDDRKPFFDEEKEKFDVIIDQKSKRQKLYYNCTVVNYAYEAYLRFLDYIEKDKNNISNDQSIFLVSKLLKDNKEIVSKLKEHYKHIYIDEYQDTDHIQRDIALMLTRDNKKFGENRIYLVGDPKQSIYRFRGAEPEVYFETMGLFDEGDPKKPDKTYAQCFNLNINFRSNTKIIEYVNDVFKRVRLTDNPYENMLVANENEIDEIDYNDDNNLIGFYKYDKTDPSEIARLILYLAENKKVRNVVKDNDGNVERVEYNKVKFKDIMVILRNHTKMNEYIHAFSASGIPTKVAGESHFNSYMQLKTFVNLFTAIATVSERNLEMAASVFKTIYPSMFIDKTIEEENEIVNDLFNELINKTAKMNAYGKAIYLANHLELLFEEEKANNDYMVNGIQSKIFQMIEEVFASNYLNGNELASRFKEYIEQAVEYESLIDDEADCVQIINMHKAKGLQAKIVFWVGIDEDKDVGSSYKNGKIYINEKTNPLPTTPPITLLDDAKLEEIKKDDDQELARFEYVIATRPREAFIYCLNSDRNGLFANEDVYKVDSLRSIDIPVEWSSSILERNNKPTDYKHKSLVFSEVSKGIKYISPSKLEGRSKTRQDEYEKCKDNLPDSVRPQSAIVGTILHKAFELLVLDEEHNVNKAVDKAINQYIAVIDDYDNLLKFIRVCVKELNKYYSDNNIYEYTLYPELKYSYSKAKDIISNGSIDLLVVNNNDCIIIDYKSDEAIYIENEEVFKTTLLEKYKVQIDEYEKALKDVGLDVNNIEKRIIYFRNYNIEKESIDLKVLKIK